MTNVPVTRPVSTEFAKTLVIVEAAPNASFLTTGQFVDAQKVPLVIPRLLVFLLVANLTQNVQTKKLAWMERVSILASLMIPAEQTLFATPRDTKPIADAMKASKVTHSWVALRLVAAPMLTVLWTKHAEIGTVSIPAKWLILAEPMRIVSSANIWHSVDADLATQEIHTRLACLLNPLSVFKTRIVPPMKSVSKRNVSTHV